METHKSKSSGAVWVLGIAGLLLFWWAVTKIDYRLERTRFSDSSSSSFSASAVVALGDNKFAVVNDNQISVYRVDPKGKVTRLDDVYTQYSKLEPNTRYTKER